MYSPPKQVSPAGRDTTLPQESHYRNNRRHKRFCQGEHPASGKFATPPFPNAPPIKTIRYTAPLNHRRIQNNQMHGLYVLLRKFPDIISPPECDVGVSMRVRRIISSLCMICILVAASLPLATADLFGFPPQGGGSDASRYLRLASDTTTLCIPFRSPQQDLRELRTTSLLPGVVAWVHRCCAEHFSRLAANEESTTRPLIDGSLLSLHCLLAV